ncbi:MAG: hypothetical protein WC476_13275 [Phycisphaerae bacterium]|jgi:hypothetical protein
MTNHTNKCVFCLKEFNDKDCDDKKTKEHVFPQSWYPDSTPKNLEKWNVYSCYKCNQEYGKIEQELLIKLGLCVDPKDAKSSGIANKVRHSLDPNCGKNERDRNARIKRREGVIKETKQLKSFPSHAILPNFGSHKSSPFSKQKIVLVLAEDLKKFSTKLVRGLTFLLDNAFIEDDYVIDIFYIDEGSDAVNRINNNLKKHGNLQHRGPGIVIERAVAQDDPKSFLYRIEVWGKFVIYGIVSKNSHV